MVDRTEARELVLLGLHQWDQQGGEELAESLIAARASNEEVAEYAQELLRVYFERASELDAAIESAAENWRLERMAVVDRSILRMATAEMMHMPVVPPKVSIDEAIELAKKYSTEKSSAFVNGILDRILGEWERVHGTG